jgi:GTP-binding protein HflX
VLEELGLEEQDRILVFNKVDRLTHAEEEALRQRIGALDSTPAVFVSAHEPATLEALREALKARLQARLAHVRVRVPVSDGEAIAQLYREAEVMDRADDACAVTLTVRVPASLLGRLAARAGVGVEDVD